MDMEWRGVSLYFNTKGDVFIIPDRGCPEYGMVESEPWFISHITEEDELYEKLKSAYDATAEGINAKPNPTPIEIITNIKNWERATRGLGLLTFVWRKDINGFELLLYNRRGGGFAGYKDIKLGETLDHAAFKPIVLENLKAELARHITKMEKKEHKKNLKKTKANAEKKG